MGIKDLTMGQRSLARDIEAKKIKFFGEKLANAGSLKSLHRPLARVAVRQMLSLKRLESRTEEEGPADQTQKLPRPDLVEKRAALVFIKTDDEPGSLGLLRDTKRLVSRCGFSVPLFLDQFNTDYDEPGDPLSNRSPRVRLAHNITPDSTRDETLGELFTGMVQRWHEMGAFVVMTSPDNLNDFFEGQTEKPEALKSMRNDGRYLELVIPPAQQPA